MAKREHSINAASRSVRNIRKITRTMELIATARFKKAMDRVSRCAATTRRSLVKLVGKYGPHRGLKVVHPLLDVRPSEASKRPCSC